MLKVELKSGDNIERALKQLKRKFNMSGTVKELRRREYFLKPSVKKREQRKKAIYIQKLRNQEDNFS